MASLMGKRVLISGATGFVGANLVRMALRQGADVHIITRSDSNKWRLLDVLESVCEHRADISQKSQINTAVRKIRPDIIFHAAVYGGNPVETDLKALYETNVTGTTNLVRAATEPGFELFVNTGSSSEYGIKNAPITENAALAPVTDYGKSKAAATLYCQSCGKKYGHPIVTLRLFSPYGCYEDRRRLIPSVTLSCLKRENPKISSTHFVRDFVFIEDVLRVYENVAELAKFPGEIFNVGSGRQHTVGDVVSKIVELTEANVTPETGHAQRWPEEPAWWQADITKAQVMLHWTPAYNLDQGLAATIDWFSKNKSLYE
jgi:nucleoside-diphosphate-sugar epimerase